MKPRVLFTAAEIDAALDGMAAAIVARMGREQTVVCLALLNGALWFAADLLRKLPRNYVLETARVSSYGDAFESSGRLDWKTPMPDVAGKAVLVLDDVLDTGLTLHTVRTELLGAGATEVLSAVAVDKHECRRNDFEADFVGLVAGDAYLLGYGLDAAGFDRNLPDIVEMV
ncbi:MAG: phosphoribosyltransferase family protein [Akkermansia sp.]